MVTGAARAIVDGPRVSSGIASVSKHPQPIQEVGPSDRVLCGLVGHEPVVLQFDAGAGIRRREPDQQACRARRHRFVAGLAPGDSEQPRSLDGSTSLARH